MEQELEQKQGQELERKQQVSPIRVIQMPLPAMPAFWQPPWRQALDP